MTAELRPTTAAPGAPAFAPLAPPSSDDDQLARDRIRQDLDTNLLVEAGAGSGKTTSLVGRMLALVARGTPVDRIAAVTFTRKAAHELRERFQLELERRVRETPPDGGDEGRRYDRALRELDRAFLGTIHSFCARLLRERPLEVGLDPNFQEVSEEPWEELRQDFWRRWIERALRGDDADLAALRRVGVDPRTLEEGFALVMAYPDVAFPVSDGAPPDPEPCRRELEALLAAARELMPRDEPAAGWDPLMSLVRRLDFHRSVNDWDDVERFCAAVEGIAASHCKPTQNRWSDTKEGKAAAKELGESFLSLLEGRVADLLRCWREHRYPVVMRFLRRAAEEFARERHATGQLGFEDLLLLTARLLRESPAVRAELGARYAHLLVDEFQDTDPIQAEVCFLLASDPAEGTDWRTVVPRPGSLFVVGDPKQSIYRFRRADIQTYELVKRRLAACGAVLALTRNFRSVRPIERLVNDHFGGGGVFPDEATAEQAPFRPMQTVKDAAGADGVYRYTLRTSGRTQYGELLALDAGAVASWIADRVASGERQAEDFLILTATKAPIAHYARALAERNVPVTTTGARLPQERELAELLVVLRAIADPENAVAVVAALEGMFFGLSPADLWSARQAGLRFSITHRPSDEAHRVGRALLQLHAWWQLAQRHPADVLIGRLLDDTGLLVHAASQPLGEARAGALLHLVEVLRAATVLGGSGITDAMEQLTLLLEAEAADAPLRPGRSDAVRVMNLHKAKGLEADVVVLAAPLDRDPPDPAVHVSRGDGDGPPVGGICVSRKERNTRLVIAQPPGWAEMQATEGAFRGAEEARLLYVAATRAGRELVVAQVERTLQKGTAIDASMWRPLAPTLDGMAARLDLTVRAAPGRRAVARDVASLQAAVTAAARGVRDASAESLRVVTVTESVKEQRAAERAYDLPRPDAAGAGNGGAAWGRAVHRAVEALGRGRRGPALATFVRAVARDEGIDDARCGELQSLLAEIERSEAWRRLVGTAGSGAPSFELTVMRRSTDGSGQDVVTEGVVDAASLGPDGWYVVDWKSDLVDDAAWAARQEQYGRQVAAYVAMLRDLTGHSGDGRVARVRPVVDGGGSTTT